MIQLPYLASARFSGPDAGALLHAQLSADIRALEPGASTFAAYCSPRGQVLGLMLVGRHEDCFRVIAAAELLPAIVQRLRMFVIRLKVDIEIPADLAVGGLQSSTDCPGTAVVFSPPAVGLHYAIDAASRMSCAGADDWKYQELRHSIAWLDRHTTEKYIPQMLGLDTIGAVSFSKGCYPGQEIIARTRYLGKVKRMPLMVEVSGEVSCPDNALVQLEYATESVDGHLVDFAPGPEQNTLLFIVTAGKEAKMPIVISCEDQSYPVL